MSDGNHFPASSSAAASCSAAGGWGAGMRGDVQRSRWRAAQLSERYSTGAASGQRRGAAAVTGRDAPAVQQLLRQ